MFTGTLTQASVYPVVGPSALRHNASATDLAHNHPSGIGIETKQADEALTNTLKQTLALVDVRVLDHVIVGSLRSLSMAGKDLI